MQNKPTASERAAENMEKISSQLAKTLKAIEELKADLMKMQKFENVAHLRDVEKLVEKGQAQFDTLHKK